MTAASTGTGLAGVSVQVYDPLGNPVASTQTGSDGTYTISGLDPGSYKVGFIPDPSYALQFYPDQPSLASAQAVSVTAGSTTSGVDAALSAGGQISGTVTDATSGSDVSNVEVDVYDSAGTFVTYAETASDGTYTVSGLPGGSYEVGFVPSATYLPEFYNGASTLASATAVSVTDGSDTSGIDAALATGGALAGTVTANGTGAPNVEVDIYDSAGNVVDSAQTASDGTYTVSGLATGSYRVGFVPTGNYLAQFYPDKPTLAAANPVSVAAGSTTNSIDAVLSPGGQITGTVTDASNSNALADVDVDLYDSSGNLLTYTETATDGTYAFSGLGTGSYKVGFSPGGGYVPQFYSGKVTLAAAQQVSVTAGSTTNSVDAALLAGGQIGGTVTDMSTGLAVAGVFVQAYDEQGNPVGSAQTASDGTYTISGLATGSDKVGFIPAGAYVPQFYNGKPTLSAAEPVTVTAGSTTSGIDARLAVAGSGQIAGTVTDASNDSPLSDVEVDVYDSGGNFVSSVQTAGDGTYEVPGLPGGAYKVGFVPGGNYLPQYYNDRETLDSADAVTVTPGSTTSGIDAALTSGGQISGTVTDASNDSPVPSVEVDLYDSSGTFLTSTQSAGDGTYSFSGLTGGAYKVGFVPGGNYLPQYYNDRETLDSADAVAVTPGSTTSGIDAALASGGQISGTVTDASTGDGVVNVEIDIYDLAGNPVATGQTASDGTYTVSALPAGTYKVGFTPFGTDHLPQFYNDASNLSAADSVSVSSGSTTGGIDAALAGGGQITGTVTDTADAPIANVEADAYDADGNLVGSAQTGSDGTYTISSLPSGTYRVGFSPGGNYIAQFYTGQPTLSAANPVVVTAGSTTSGIDAALSAGGQIAGTVTDASSGQPIAGVFVQAYDAGGNPVASGQTASDGTYLITGLPTGSYEVGFSPSGGYAAQFFSGTASLATAQPVPVTAGSTASGIDAALVPAPAPPTVQSQSVPGISGATTAGQSLTESHARWTGNPTSYGYQWEDCDAAGANCSAITGATQPSYTLAASDVGHTIRVQETATNAGGTSLPVSSLATATVQAAPSSAPSSNPSAGSPPAGGTGPTGSGAGSPVVVSGPTPAQIRSALLRALTASGPSARIAQLLRHGGYTTTFAAPSGGHLVIDWYYVPKGAHLAGAGKPTLVAVAAVTLAGAGRVKVRIVITARGRTLLHRVGHLKLTAKGGFGPRGAAPTTATRTIQLSR